jgi:hypothetical protein
MLAKRARVHCGAWDVSSTCMKTTKLHSCCLELTLMFVLKLLLAKEIIPTNLLSLFVEFLLCIVYWIIKALLCFIVMCRTKVHCKHGVFHWFQTTLVCLCSTIRLARDFLHIIILKNPKNVHEIIIEICIESPWEVLGEHDFKFYKIVHMCFCDFQLINDLDSKVHACMLTIATYKWLWTSEPWRDTIRNQHSGIKVCQINHLCIFFSLGKHFRTPLPFSYVANYWFIVNMM